jgi:hypothetical protein
MNRRTLLASFLASLTAAPMVLRQADDLDYGDPGRYGQRKMKTPHIRGSSV